jgi:hypothetical protein
LYHIGIFRLDNNRKKHGSPTTAPPLRSPPPPPTPAPPSPSPPTCPARRGAMAPPADRPRNSSAFYASHGQEGGGGGHPLANYAGCDFRPGRRFESEVIHRFGTPPLLITSWLVLSPCGFLSIFVSSRLTEESVGLALHCSWWITQRISYWQSQAMSLSLLRCLKGGWSLDHHHEEDHHRAF